MIYLKYLTQMQNVRFAVTWSVTCLVLTIRLREK